MDEEYAAQPATAAIPVRAMWPPDGSSSVVLIVAPPIAPGAIAGLCDQVSFLVLTCDADVVTCDVRAVTEPDATTIDALAKMQLTARRLGRAIRLRHPTSFLRALLTLTGLVETMPIADAAAPATIDNGGSQRPA